MASIIRIKRSEVSGNPAVLGAGELAYSSLADSGANGGDRLYIGTGTETDGNAVNHTVIGGKFFTDMLDHAKGTLTANSALIVDSNKKINELFVDNISLDTNTITTSNTNGNLILDANGTGKISFYSAYTFPRAAGTTNQVLAYDGAGNLTFQTIATGSTSFNIAGDIGGTDTFNSGDTLTFTGTGAIDTTISNDQVAISVATATTTVLGVASFSGTNFDVATGAVSIKVGGVSNSNLANSSLTVGTTSISLGASTTTLAGLTSVTSTSFTGALTGNASTATTLETARTIAISGAITGTATSFNGSANISIPITALDVGHVDVTGTLAVDHGGTGTTTSTGTGSLVLADSPAFTGTPTAPTATAGTNTTQLATTAFVTAAVDAAKSGLDPKESVRVATTANITLSGTQVIDGVSLSVGDRVLVKDQTTGSQNGIYVVAAGAWSRSTDADAPNEITAGLYTFVTEGSTHADSGWVLTTNDVITIGTTSLTFSQFSGAGQIVAGDGLTKTGNTLNVVAGTGIVVGADDVALTGQALALHNLGTNGIFVRTGSGTVAARSVVGTTNRITITNGDGVSGNPTIDIASTYVGQATITTVGTLTSGELGAGFTTVAVARGGTGATTFTSRGALFGNGTGSILATVASTIDGSFLREDATGNPYWSNEIDGGAY